jgi:hypothetical protein
MVLGDVDNCRPTIVQLKIACVHYALITLKYSAIADLHNFQFTVAHALGFSIFTSRLLATDLNTETSASDHYELFLLFRHQSLCTPLS